ncbi:sugar phosphate nucleotidyltransferase [Clostridium sp.]|uniref:sugar phosphate nucleotidyltransferase n=1 Tax=Clostridium sp. TaxID=1506 RepID=UPI0025BEC79E|nr:sugar phosphate nucleotidyltransferase [Clostridium sp.]MBS4957636.1 NTP transferase domain-containing protein [Clostridium sp.]MDU4884573.1 sugar phosphate nucleotidyltransferase [Clostridium celatum]MDU7077743.1 sugar phosphate nucleotidyltransferase [Clostridium celatum]
MRAILLAAGMGTRLRPLTLETPKSLIEVNGKALLERQIEFLKEKGINDIIIVTGYLNEKFEYLKEKYSLKLIFNDKYDIYNNIYSMYLVRDYLADAYVIDADVYINRNFILSDIDKSTYFSAYKKNVKNEWKLCFDENNKVNDIKIINGDGFILCGVSYWSKNDGALIKSRIEEALKTTNFKNLYWDDIVKSNIKDLDVRIEKINSDDIYEIDNIEELKLVKSIVESK